MLLSRKKYSIVLQLTTSTELDKNRVPTEF